MRFGGHIAAVACLVLFSGGARAQSQDAAQGQAAPAQGTQSQINNPQASAQAAQDQQQNANPTDKSNPLEKKTPSAEEQYQQRINEYDPLANTPQQPQVQEVPGVTQPGPISVAPSRGAEPAGLALPGPAIGGPDVDMDAGDLPDYTGPAVLSRSYTLLRPAVPVQQKWIPVLGVNGIYDSGLYGLEVSSQGIPTTQGTEGAEVMWGISGRHYFHNDVLGVNYRGDLQEYSSAKEYDGTNNWLTVDYTHAFSKRLSATLVETGSIYSQNYALENPVALSDVSVAAVNLSTTPNVQVFDNGLKQFNTSADVTYQKTARLSFDAGGSWFAIDRNATYLVGATGDEARADALYRLTKRTTVGLAYSYDQYWFAHGEGRSDFDSVDVIYSWAISRTVQLRARGGASRLNSSGLTTVALPASLASLLGVGSVTVEYRDLSWISNYSAQLIKYFRRGRSAGLSFNRGLSPGNGLFLTSVNTTATANGSLVLMRRYYVSVGGGYDSLTAPGQGVGDYKSYFAFAGVSRDLNHGLQGNLRFDFRHFVITESPLLQNEYRVTLGVSWSPAEGLFRLW